jgi:hypothetical protein
MNNTNKQIFIDTINKPLVIYDFFHGTKYRLNRCGILIGAVGLLSGISVYAMTDKPIKKYLIPSAALLGSSVTILLLAKNNYSLKNKMALRNIEHIKEIITKKISNDYSIKNKLEHAANNCLEYAAKQQLIIDTTNHLATATNKQNTSNLVIANQDDFINKFKQASLLLVTYINDIIDQTKKRRIDIIEQNKYQCCKDLDFCNIKLKNCQEALIHINVFICMEDNSQLAHDALINNLQGILSYEELQDIDTLLLKSLLINTTQEKVIARKITPIETSKFNLINWAKSYIQESRRIRNNIQLITHKYNIKVNSCGVSEFLNQNDLIACMPK